MLLRQAIHTQKNKTEPLSHSKNELKIDDSSKCKSKITKSLEKNIGESLHDFELGKTFIDMTSKAQVTKKSGFHQN